MKALIRKLADRYAGIARLYAVARQWYHHVRKLWYFASDVRSACRHMRWSEGGRARYWACSAELLFQYHKLEKGLCMPGEPRFFGYDPAIATLDLLVQWRARDYPREDPVYLGALEALWAYRQRLERTPPPRGEILLRRLDAELEGAPASQDASRTPVPVLPAISGNASGMFHELMLARRSVRDFDTRPVDPAAVARAVAVAQWSPSACNRQPARVHAYSQRTQIDALLALQNGNRGFGQTVASLLVLTAETSGFFDASERNEPYVDGGLFAMALILALQAEGIASCCLNWCVAPAEDQRAHALGGIADSERIVMFIAIGHAATQALVPRSPRRALQTVYVCH
ncbi:MAG: hypothetical protein BSR46_14285 [Candidatus Dactylopiibacterium carminicum]|uniref:nitroreductase family protein n=1 Tax=Candidatus Dactylopiibacterium carminicum TaxID=857335 RepID=UPI000BCA5E6D|nr:nitroreductase family protein [Candidatus Dactylopiibacterium carminicum]PAS97144.1 MAG: hypothetical protein BSR46_14285 [Candidatus Dactylopiibacterium carminicum]